MRISRWLWPAPVLALLLSAPPASAARLATSSVRTDANQRVRCAVTNLGTANKTVKTELLGGDQVIDGPNFLIPPNATFANLENGGGFFRCVFTFSGSPKDVRGALLVQDLNDKTVLHVDAR